MKKDWEIKKLGEVCEVKCGATPLKSDKTFWKNGSIPWFTVDDIRSQGRIIKTTKKTVTEKALKKLTVFPKNTILLCCTASVGEYAITDIELTCNQQFNGLIIKNTNYLNPNYLFHFTSTLKDRLLSVSGKTTIDFVSNSKVCDIDIPVPPLEEQKRIVKILDEKFAQLEKIKTNAQTNLQNAKDLFQSKLAKAFSNTTWEKKTIGEVCLKKENIKWKNENASTEYQYIDLSAVDRESKNISDTQIITKESAPSRAQQIVKTGDILFGTTRPTLKRFCLLSDDYNGQICSTGFCVIRPNQNIVSSDWMFYQFYNDEFYKYIEPLQKGANYPAVTDKDIMNYNIFVPPLPEQKRIVKELDTLSEKVRQLQEIYTKQIANCDELKQAYLQKAFEGEL